VNTPPLFLAAAILFWGWQTAHWELAIALAIAFEAPRVVASRWEIAPDRLDRASDVGVALTVLVFGYFYATAGNPRAITQLFLWLPVCYAPLALAQAWSTTSEIELATVLIGLRGEKRRRRVRVNIGYVYAALWVVGASAANRRYVGFEIVAFALVAWALWYARPVQRIAPARLAAWTAILCTAGAIGVVTHNGLSSLQNWIEGSVADWLGGEGAATNPYRSDTDIGRIGEIKLTDRIVMRVQIGSVPGREHAGKLLLHRASYDAYSGVRWRARNAEFAPVKAAADGTWPLAPEAEGALLERLTIVEEATRPNPVLSLPAGTRRITQLTANEMKRNAMGAVQVDLVPGFIRYEPRYVPGAADAAAPGPDDLALPKEEAQALGEIAGSLQLAGLAPAQALAHVESYFADGFRYSLYQAAPAGGRSQGTALVEFLRTGRAGHCEYFASATALLLRAAGIPARYATGFAVLEWSAREGAYIVRTRHAHAWVRAWIDGRWIDVDTTPATWVQAEAEQAAWWSGIADLWNWLRFRYAESQRDGGGPSLPVIAALIAVAIWVGWRLFGRASRSQARKAEARPRDTVIAKQSAFQGIEDRLAREGLARGPQETVREWVARLRMHAPVISGLDDVERFAWLHTRLRFDPAGLPAEDEERFAAGVRDWLARFHLTSTLERPPIR
jgi:hypothetical protein